MYEKLLRLSWKNITTVYVNRQGTDLHDVHVIRHIIEDLHKFALNVLKANTAYAKAKWKISKWRKEIKTSVDETKGEMKQAD